MQNNDFFDFDKWFDSEETVIVGNRYIEDTTESLNLIAKLLKFQKNEKFKDILELRKYVGYRLIRICEKAELDDFYEIRKKLEALCEKVFQQRRLKLLKDKAVVAIGGKFSSGKSSFINSLLAEILLPENTVATTSVPTYLVHDEKTQFSALGKFNNEIELNEDEIKAMTHEFYEKYKLDFSNIITDLFVSCPAFNYNNIAIVDTPGYSKTENSETAELSDYEKAMKELKSADFVIWVIDIENGCISATDIEFLLSVASDEPVLIVFNKCDKKPKSDVMDVIDITKKILTKYELKVFDVVPYSAASPELYNTDRIKAFFEKANSTDCERDSVADQIISVMDEIEKSIRIKKQRIENTLYMIEKHILESVNITEMSSITDYYIQQKKDFFETGYILYELQKCQEKITNIIKKTGEGEN